MEPLLGTFHDAETGETITRELTLEESKQITDNGLVWPKPEAEQPQ